MIIVETISFGKVTLRPCFGLFMVHFLKIWKRQTLIEE